mgnify:CR=1 FL=1
MIDVAIVVQGLGGGGSERVATILSNAFINSGNNVTVVCVYSGASGYLLDSRVRVVFALSNKHSIAGLIERNMKVRQVLESLHPDVVLSFVTDETIFAGRLGIPIVQSLRNDPEKYECAWYYRFLRDYSFGKADRIVFQTRQARDFFPASYRAKGVVLPNPLKVESLPKWDNRTKSRQFVAVGRLNAQKNYPMLFKAFAQFCSNRDGYTLAVYGEGELHKSLDALIAELDMKGKILLKGHSDEVHRHIAESFCFVMSSDYEGVSNSMLEALCMGMPCIVTDYPSGGAREYITDGKSGILVKVGDFVAMADAMGRVADNRDFARSLGESALQVRERVDDRIVTKEWERMLEEVASSDRR